MRMLIFGLSALAVAWAVSRALRWSRRRDAMVSSEALGRWEGEGGAAPSGAQTGGSGPTD
jgi:hypothetical protein